MRRRLPRTSPAEQRSVPRARLARDGAPLGGSCGPDHAETPIAVRIEGLALRHPGGPIVLEIDELTIRPGKVVALVGPNGSGKSTLISALAGLLAPARGTISINGVAPARQGCDIAVAFQATPATAGLPLTVRDVVSMGRFPHRGLIGALGADDHIAIEDALHRLSVDDLGDRQLEELSGGQRQRVLVARALAQRARVLLLDEPTTGLDLTSRDRILATISDERRRGTTVVMATHQLDDADGVADLVAVVAGRLIAHGPPADVLRPEVLQRAYVPQTPMLRR